MAKDTDNRQTLFVPYITYDGVTYSITVREGEGTFYNVEVGMRSIITARRRLKLVREEMFDAFVASRRAIVGTSS